MQKATTDRPNAALRTVVVDDELRSRELIASLIDRYTPFAALVGTAATALEGIRCINDLRPDLVLLDIEMPNGNAFDLLAAFPQRDFEIIFTTAHEHYALQAIKTHPADYLLKPIDPEQFMPALRGVHDRRPITRPDVLRVSTLQGHYFIHHHDILHVDADGSYSHVHLLGGERITVSRPIGQIEAELPHPGFFRCHHSHMLNVRHVKALLHTDGGVAEFNNGARVPVATRKQADLLRLLDPTDRSVGSAG